MGLSDEQRGAVNLARAKMSDKQVAEAGEMLELQLGMRCGGCGRRIGIGIKFTSISVRKQSPVSKLSACDREDCGFAEEARDGGTVMEVFQLVWLDEAGVDAPAAAIVKRQEPVRSRSAEV